MITLEERFWSKVDVREPYECWGWKACKAQGYGKFSVSRSKWRYAHRVSWEFIHGTVPSGKELHHICSNRSCVNPAHLELVTRKEHCTIDRSGDRSGRRKFPERYPSKFPKVPPERVVRGEKCYNSKLTEDDVRWLRWVYADKRYSQSQLAKHLGVSREVVRDTILRKQWKHVR